MNAAIMILTVVLAVIGSHEDIKRHMISNRTLCYGCGIVVLKLMAEKDVVQILAGAFAGFAILYAAALLSKGGIGGGDIKIMTVFGAITGANCIMLAQLTGLCIALAGALFVRKRREIWLVPYLSIGVIISYATIMLLAEKG